MGHRSGRSQLKRKKLNRIKVRPLKKPRVVALGLYERSGGVDPLTLLMEMGYNIYEHPADGDFCIVSPKRLTFRDVRNQCVYYGIDPKWWDSEFTDLNLSQELDFAIL
jgi:hypothetical protein